MKTTDQHFDNPTVVAGLRIMILERILKEREEELLASKGPCSHKGCALHFAHRGPCDVRESSTWPPS